MHQMLLGGLAAVALLGCSAPHPPNQFNLVCDGTTEGQTFPKPSKFVQPLHNVYVVDLDHRIWCDAACANGPSPIYGFDELSIVLSNSGNVDNPLKVAIDRSSGELDSFMAVGALSLHGKGKCLKAAFTGLPEHKF
jgi:hypothetical protein